MYSKFNLGKIEITHEVSARIAENLEFAKFVANAFRRYRNADWGDVCAKDKTWNDAAIGGDDRRTLGEYCPPGCISRKLWIVTEYDHSRTIILLSPPMA